MEVECEDRFMEYRNFMDFKNYNTPWSRLGLEVRHK